MIINRGLLFPFFLLIFNQVPVRYALKRFIFANCFHFAVLLFIFIAYTRIEMDRERDRMSR